MKELRITNGVAIVDDDDYEWLKKHSWTRVKNGYVKLVIHAGLTAMAMHRAIIKAKNGEIVDHINGDPLDNRKSNLRICTNQQNLFNRGKQKNNTTGYKGVSFSNGKFRSKTVLNGKSKHLGSFDNAVDAAKAYDEFAKKHHGEFARLNFPSHQ